jgi:hypothetical protein
MKSCAWVPGMKGIEISDVIVCPLAFEINVDLPSKVNDRRHVSQESLYPSPLHRDWKRRRIHRDYRTSDPGSRFRN